MAAAPWATTADCTALTGITVTQTVLDQAIASIGVLIGLIPDVERSDITDRDRYFLKLAACYQAAWLNTQPDMFERNDVASVTQEGQSVAYKPDALVLAPMARRSIKRLSWRSKGHLTPDVVAAAAHGLIDPVSDAADDYLPWVKS